MHSLRCKVDNANPDSVWQSMRRAAQKDEHKRHEDVKFS